MHGDSVIPFNDPDFINDPFPYFARLQVDHPAYKSHFGPWLITRYEDVSRLLYDRSLTVEAEEPFPLNVGVMGRDGDAHTRLRRTHSKWFTLKAVATFKERARELAAEYLQARVGEDGFVDAMSDIILPATTGTMFTILGLDTDPDGGEALRAAHHRAGAVLRMDATDAALDDAVEAWEWLGEYIDGLIDNRPNRHRDGLIDVLLELEGEGELTRDELRSSITLLLIAGHIDVAYLIANALRLLAERPQLADDFRTRPELREKIINEVVRLDAPEPLVHRTTTVPIEAAGVTIPAGEPVILVLSAANRDPSVFDHPNEFDHHRDQSLSKHVSFGGGVHMCLGQVLARAEADAILTEIVERFATIELVAAPTYKHTNSQRQMTELKLKLA